MSGVWPYSRVECGRRRWHAFSRWVCDSLGAARVDWRLVRSGSSCKVLGDCRRRSPPLAIDWM